METNNERVKTVAASVAERKGQSWGSPLDLVELFGGTLAEPPNWAGVIRGTEFPYEPPVTVRTPRKPPRNRAAATHEIRESSHSSPVPRPQLLPSPVKIPTPRAPPAPSAPSARGEPTRQRAELGKNEKTVTEEFTSIVRRERCAVGRHRHREERATYAPRAHERTCGRQTHA